MNRKQIAIVVCVIALATGALALASQSIAVSAKSSGQTEQTGQAGTQSKPQPDAESMRLRKARGLPSESFDSSQASAESLPQYVIYAHVFSTAVELKKRAEEQESRSADGSALRNWFRRQAELDDRQAQTFDEIAAECAEAVAATDAKAKKIIDDARALHPGGALAPGEAPPLPPAELGVLQEERNDTVLRARDRLRKALGEEAFQRFDAFVQRKIAPSIQAVRLDAPSTPATTRRQ